MGEGILKGTRFPLNTTQVARVLFVLVGVALIGLGVVVLTNQSVVDWMIFGMSLVRRTPPMPDWSRNLRLSGVEAMVVGALIIAFGMLVLPRWAQVVSLAEKKHIVLMTSIGALIVLWLPIVLLGRSETIAGERYWWLGDDAMISMRYAHNLATGGGLVWNPGERVEGYTNFLWTVYMAVVHWLPVPASKISLIVLLTNIVLSALTIPVIIRLGKLLGGQTLAILGALAGFVLSRNIIYWASYGYETVLLTLLFLVGITRVLEESKLGQPNFLTYIVIAAMALVRADGLVLSGMVYVFSFYLNSNKKTVLVYSVLSLIIPLAHEIFRIYYYGDLLPNTAYLKTINWNGKYAAGVSYVVTFASHYILAIVLAIVSALVSEQPVRRILLGALFVYMLYIVYVGGDSFNDFRFFVPFIPLLLVLAFIGIQETKQLIFNKSPRLVLGTLCLATMPLITPGYPVALLPYIADPGNVSIGLYLKENTPATSRVADFWAGSVLYFSERPAIDLLGKSDLYIARLSAASDGRLPGHNKFNFEYSLGVLKPDYVISHFKLPVTDEQMRREATGDFAYTGLLYFDPVFREHCFANPVAVDTWRTIFACHW